MYKGGRRCIVCFERKICNCRFKYDGIPCAHAIAVVKTALANTYEVPMISMLDKDDWSVSKFVLEEIVLPP
ncbi:hypothetical protein H5410_013978, partial [Solanum commersonii]